MSEKKNQEFGLRRSQLFGPYGVGSVFPCPGDQSLMIAGLDSSPFIEEGDIIDDSRLARHVGVKELVAVPVEEAIPAVRFPGWVYCPACGHMERRSYGDSSTGYCSNKACKAKRKLIPERFVVVCPEGHIDDFPIVEWVHRGPVSDPACASSIKRITRGGSLALGDIVYKCENCGEKRSLSGASRPGALEEDTGAGFSCRGAEPWLMRDHDSKGCQCKEPLHVVQRGGSNVWYADIASSIYIPDGKNPEALRLLDEKFDDLKAFDSQGLLDSACNLLASRGVSAEQLKQAYLERTNGEQGDSKSDAEFRWEEFCTLKSADKLTQQKGIFSGKAFSVEDYSSGLMSRSVSSVTLVSMLRETRALVGFSRLYPDANEGKPFRERRSLLSRNQIDWTIATQSTGEGIFLSFNREAVERWAAREQLKKRFSLMQQNYDAAAASRRKETKALNPAFILLHSFAHALMLALSEECGYSPASIRERIYCDKYIVTEDRHPDMLGVLVYTASGDSEGSLGGLVRSGRSGRFERIFEKAVDDARWCSMDPVCIDSKGQGPESCNLAACYSCALVPETACETGNKLLDRAFLIGTIDEPEAGFFNEEPGLVSLIDLEPDFEECASVEGLSFSRACKCALGSILTSEEELVLTQLCEKGSGEDLEPPHSTVVFFDDDGNEADALLAWKDAKVILLNEKSREEFEDSFGRFEGISGWAVVDLGKANPEDVIELLKGRE